MSEFEPTEEDVKSLAIALHAALQEGLFRQSRVALESNPATMISMCRMARAAFEHSGYIPSIVAARVDANKRIDTVPVAYHIGKIEALRDTQEVMAARIAALEADNAVLSEALEASVAIIAELDTRLVQAVQKPFPAGALKPSSGDPRRVGG